MNQKILPIAFKRCTVDVQYQLVCNFSSFPWCFEWSVVRHLGIQTPTNMSNRKRKEGEMKMLTGARCTASEQSWQTALVSPFFSFFLAHDWNKSRGPRWVGRRMCRCCSRFFDFPPAFAESSWQWGRPALFPRSTCDGQLQISHLISLSVYFCLTPFLSHIGIFLTTFSLSLPSPSFVFRFDLHEERTTFLSAQAAFLPVKKGWVRAAPSVSRIITGFCFFFFFCHSCRVWGKSENFHREALRHKGLRADSVRAIQTKSSPSGYAVMEHKYWCVSWKQHCRVMRSCTRCVLQCFLFFLFFFSSF